MRAGAKLWFRGGLEEDGLEEDVSNSHAHAQIAGLSVRCTALPNLARHGDASQSRQSLRDLRCNHGLRRFQTFGVSGVRVREAVHLHGAGREAAGVGGYAKAARGRSGRAAAAHGDPEAGSRRGDVQRVFFAALYVRIARSVV